MEADYQTHLHSWVNFHYLKNIHNPYYQKVLLKLYPVLAHKYGALMFLHYVNFPGSRTF